jgi:hypothetical protein
VIAGFQQRDAFTDLLYDAGGLMPGDDRGAATPLAFHQMDVAVADGHGRHADLHLVLLWGIDLDGFHHQGLTEFVADCCFHAGLLAG